MKDSTSIIHEILLAKNPIKVFESYMDKLPGAKFLLFNIGESQFQPICGDSKFGKYSIVELGNYKNTVVLEKNAIIKGDNYALKVNQCMDFDSNVIGAWKNVVFDKKEDSDLMNMLLFIKENGKSLSCTPYLFESGANYFDIEKEVIYRNLLAFSILDYINKSELKKKHFILDSSVYVLADERWNELVKLEVEIKTNPVDRYEYIYCLLLKTFYIKHSSKKSIDNKILQLLDSINNEIFSYWENELVLCYLFLRGDKSVEKFFGGVQVNAKDIFRKLRGMAWDLFHIRCLEMYMGERNCKQSFTYLHSFCSADRGILEIVKLNPIIRMAFYNGVSVILHEKNIFNLCKHLDIYGILSPYANKRKEMCMKTDYKELAERFEKDVLSIMKQ